MDIVPAMRYLQLTHLPILPPATNSSKMDCFMQPKLNIITGLMIASLSSQ